MDTRYAVFVVLFCVYSEESRILAQSFLNDEGFRELQDIDVHKAEHAMKYCREQLEECTETDFDSDQFRPETGGSSGIEFDPTLLGKRIMQNATAGLILEKKEFAFDCLRENNILEQVLSKEQERWAYKFEKLFASWSSIPRRYLREKRRQVPALLPLIHKVPPVALRLSPIHDEVPSASPGSSPGFATAPIFEVHSVAPGLSPGFATAPIYGVPSEAPGLSRGFATAPVYQVPAASPSVHLQPPTPLDTKHPWGLANGVSPGLLWEDNKNQMYVVAVAATSCVALFTIIALCCVLRVRQKVNPEDGQRDDKDVLDLSSNDIAAGSEDVATIGSSLNASCGSTRTTEADDELETKIVALPLPEQKTSLPLPPSPPKPPVLPPPPPSSVPLPPPIGVRRCPNNPRHSRDPYRAPHHQRTSTGQSIELSDDSAAHKTKLKPFFWDKVNANSNRSMVWNEIKEGSFQIDEDMMVYLFGSASADKRRNHKSGPQNTPNFIQILEQKKAQNLAILLKAWNVTTEEVCDAIKEGYGLPVELGETLLKMAPTTDEELQLRMYSGDVSLLGPAERFLKAIVEIPFAFKRLELVVFMSTFEEEISAVKESFAILEVACNELKNSRLFLKLLEAVLKTGNRMNDGTYRGGATAFKLDTLLKLSDVKGTDGKTTLLHFVVQEIIRFEGAKAAREMKENKNVVDDSSHETEEYYQRLGLQVVSGLSTQLENVVKAAHIDNESIRNTASKLRHSLIQIKEFLETEMKSVEGNAEIHETLIRFVDESESDIRWLVEEEKRIMDLVKSTVDYFHGKAGKDEGLRVFVIVRDFLLMLEKACSEVKDSSNFP